MQCNRSLIDGVMGSEPTWMRLQILSSIRIWFRFDLLSSLMGTLITIPKVIIRLLLMHIWVIDNDKCDY